ncbi:hypothetical protein QJR26_18700 (plasmid) [Clostridium baratii]
MKKVGSFLLRNVYYIFSRYKFSYYVRCYGMLMAIYFITKYMGMYYRKDELIILGISMIFYPFSRYTYFYLKEMFLGNKIIRVNILLYYLCKLFMFSVLLCLSIPIGGLAVIYILIVNNSRYYLEKKEEKKMECINNIVDNLI